MQNRAVTIRIFALALVCVLHPPSKGGQAAADDSNVVELTRFDLFSLPDWEHRRVAIDGFVLGMSRSQAFEIAGASRLALRPNMPGTTRSERKSPCRQASCSISQINGNWIGIDLFFDSDRLTKIKVSVPVDAYPEVKKVNIARKFKGLTNEFFNNYSDSFRDKILGSVKGKETPDKIPDSTFVYVEFDYPGSGVIIHTTIDKRDRPPKPFDLEVDFIDHR